MGIIVIYLFSLQAGVLQYPLLISSNKNSTSSNTFNSQINTISTSNQPNCWTFLIYVSANNNLEKFAINAVHDMLRGSIGIESCVRIILQIDRSPKGNLSLGYSNTPLSGESIEYTNARRYEISNGSLIPITGSNGTLSEDNMGNKSVFRSFLSWGMENYPANHTVLILWGYGMGANGVSYDEGNESQLRLSDLKEAIQNVEQQTNKQLDVIGFDASLMASASVLVELKDVTKIIIASESMELSHGWNYERTFGVFKGSTLDYLTPDSWARSVVSSYDNYYKSINVSTASLGDYNTYYVNYLVETLREFSQALVSSLRNSTNNKNFATAQALEYAVNVSKSFSSYQFDLSHLMTLFNLNINDSHLLTLANAVKTAVQYSTNDVSIGSALHNATGISITFSLANNNFLQSTDQFENNFFKETYWGDVLVHYQRIFSNQSYTAFKNSYPLQNTSNPLINIKIHPVNTHVSYPFNEMFNTTQLFNYSISTANALPSGGTLLVYEENSGGRSNFNPDFIIPFSNISSGIHGSFNYTFHLNGLVHLKAEFIPSNLHIIYGSSPYIYYTQDYLVQDNSSYIKVLNQNTFTNVFLVNEPVYLNFSLINIGYQTFQGGSLSLFVVADSNNSVLETVTLSIGQIMASGIYNISIKLNKKYPTGVYEYNLVLDNKALLNRPNVNLFALPNHYSVINPIQYVIASLNFDGFPSYHWNGFFDFNAYYLHPSVTFTSPFNPSSLGDFHFTLSVNDQYSTVYSENMTIVASTWQYSNGVYTCTSPLLPSFNQSFTFLTPGKLYSYFLTTNLSGELNLLESSFYFQPFDTAKSYVVITDFSVSIDYTTSRWLINTTLENLSDVPVDNSYDYSLLQIYSLTDSNYYSIYRKNIASGLPAVPGHAIIHDSFVINLNPDNFPFGEIIVNYNYYNSLGSYDIQQQTTIRPILLTHDFTAPKVAVNIPSTAVLEIPFTIRATITDVNPFSYSIVLNSLLISSGLIGDSSTLVSNNPDNSSTYSFSKTYVFPHNGSYSLKLIITDLSMNQTVVSKSITVTNQPNNPSPSSTDTSATNTTNTSSNSSQSSSLSNSSNTENTSTRTTSSKNHASSFISIGLLLVTLLVLPVQRKVRRNK